MTVQLTGFESNGLFGMVHLGVKGMQKTAIKQLEQLTVFVIKFWEEISTEELAAIVDDFPKSLTASISARADILK